MKNPFSLLTEYLNRASEKTQAQIEVYIIMGIIMVPYFLFFILWVVLQWSLMAALAPSVVLGSLGYVMFYSWRNKIITEAAGLPAVKMTLYWSESEVMDVDNVLSGWRSLLEREVSNPHITLNGPDEVLVGKYYTETEFMKPMYAPDGREFKRVIWIHDTPKDKVFRRIPNQWFTYNGMMFLASTARISAVFCGYKDEIEGFTPVFKVVANPEYTRLMQIGLGLKPASASVREVKRALRLSTTHEAMRYALDKMEIEAQNRALIEHSRDARTMALSLVGKLLENSDEIRRMKRYEFVKNRKFWIMLILLFLGGLVVLKYLGFW